MSMIFTINIAEILNCLDILEVKVEVEVEADSLMIEDTIKVMTEEETILDRNLDQNRIHHQQEKLKRIQDLDLQADLQ